VLVDLGLDLLVPPFAYLAAAAAGGTVLSLGASWLSGRVLWPVWPWAASLASVVLYVARGWWLSGTGIRGLLGLAAAPAYLVWKIGLILRSGRGARQGWVRTPRDGGKA
jgi:1,2-diacylglycerol 3-beta-glucosyltransferase